MTSKIDIPVTHRSLQAKRETRPQPRRKPCVCAEKEEHQLQFEQYPCKWCEHSPCEVSEACMATEREAMLRLKQVSQNKALNTLDSTGNASNRN